MYLEEKNRRRGQRIRSTTKIIKTERGKEREKERERETYGRTIINKLIMNRRYNAYCTHLHNLKQNTYLE